MSTCRAMRPPGTRHIWEGCNKLVANRFSDLLLPHDLGLPPLFACLEFVLVSSISNMPLPGRKRHLYLQFFKHTMMRLAPIGISSFATTVSFSPRQAHIRMASGGHRSPGRESGARWRRVVVIGSLSTRMPGGKSSGGSRALP